MRWQGSLSAVVLLNLIAGSAIAQAPYQNGSYQQSNYAPNWTMPALEPAWPDGQVRQQQTNQPMRYQTPQPGNQYAPQPQSYPQPSIQRQPSQLPQNNGHPFQGQGQNQYPAQGQNQSQWSQQRPDAFQPRLNSQYGQGQYGQEQFGQATNADPQFSGAQFGSRQSVAPRRSYDQQTPLQQDMVGTNFYPRQNDRSNYQPSQQPFLPASAPRYGRQDQPLQPIQETLPDPAPQQPAYENEPLGQGYLQRQNSNADGSVGFEYGQDGANGGYSEPCGDIGCCRPCITAGVLFSVEATYFKYLRSDGTRYGTSGNQEIVEFDGALAPRFTIGYLPECYPGIRLRWFDFEDYAPGSVVGQGLGADISLVDLELFRPVEINPYWGLEFSGGVRFVSFREIMADGNAPDLRINDIDAFGGVFGVQSNYRIFLGSVYTRARLAVLSGDKFHRNDNTPVVLSLNDTVVGMTEVGFGYEMQHCFTGRSGCRNHTAFGRVGAEWQHWHNFSTEFSNIAPSSEDSGGPSDVGLVGLVLELGFYY